MTKKSKDGKGGKKAGGASPAAGSKPKHSLDPNRPNKSGGHLRDAATVSLLCP